MAFFTNTDIDLAVPTNGQPSRTRLNPILKNVVQVDTPSTDTYFAPDARIFRWGDRVFLGLSNTLAGDTTNSPSPLPTRPYTGYLDRSAVISCYSPNGGTGGSFGSNAARKYSVYGHVPWTASTAVTAGDKLGFGSRLYTVTTSGTTGTAGPSHTSGTVTNGTAELRFDDFTYAVPIALGAAALADVEDGTGTWAIYNEIVRTSSGGTAYCRETVAKNQGSNVINNPYRPSPGGATIGDWMPGGGDASIGAPANPSTCAIVIGKNGSTWNKGIVIAADAITGTDGNDSNFGEAIALGKGHIIAWYTPAENIGAQIYSQVDDNAERVALSFQNDELQVLARGTLLATYENGAGASTRFYPRMLGLTGGAEIRVGGTGNGDLTLTPLGTGAVRIPAAALLQNGTTILTTDSRFRAFGGTSTNVAYGFTVDVSSGVFYDVSNSRVGIVRGGGVGILVGRGATVNDPLLGFFGVTPAARPTVTGSRGGNAALADLLNQLATLGLILNGTTA